MIEPVYVLTCRSCGNRHVFSISEYLSLEYRSTRVPLDHPTVSDYLNITSDCCCAPDYVETRGYRSRIYFGERRETFRYYSYDDMFLSSDCLEKQTVYTFEKVINIEYENQIIGIATELTYSSGGGGYVDAVLKRNDESFINRSYNLGITGDELLVLWKK